ALRFPAGEEARRFQLAAVLFAMRRAGEAIERTSGIGSFEDEDIGEDAFDSARIDVGLVRNVATFAQTIPITHQQVTVSVFHCPHTPTECLFPRSCLAMNQSANVSVLSAKPLRRTHASG